MPPEQGPMLKLPRIVDSSRLQTAFSKGYTIHKYAPKGNHSNRSKDDVRKEFWKTEQRLGGGSYGTVFLQKCVKGHVSSEATRAVKVIPTMEKGNRIDWVRELETIMEFSHQASEEYFVKSFGWFQDIDLKNTCIAMEYLEYGDLEHYLKESAINEPDAKDICFQLLGGLRFMHGKNFAHRDLKPGNILIKSKPPAHWWVKIGDFGLSKRVEETLNGNSTIRGTLGYMAPELYQQEKTIDAKPADMWSLGAIVHKMITQKLVFEPGPGLWLYSSGLQELPIASITKDCSENAVNFFTGLMARTPVDRLTAETATAHEWLEEFRIQPSPVPSSTDSDLPDLALDGTGFLSLSPEPWSSPIPFNTSTTCSGVWTEIPIKSTLSKRTEGKEQPNSASLSYPKESKSIEKQEISIPVEESSQYIQAEPDIISEKQTIERKGENETPMVEASKPDTTQSTVISSVVRDSKPEPSPSTSRYLFGGLGNLGKRTPSAEDINRFFNNPIVSVEESLKEEESASDNESVSSVSTSPYGPDKLGDISEYEWLGSYNPTPESTSPKGEPVLEKIAHELPAETGTSINGLSFNTPVEAFSSSEDPYYETTEDLVPLGRPDSETTEDPAEGNRSVETPSTEVKPSIPALVPLPGLTPLPKGPKPMMSLVDLREGRHPSFQITTIEELMAIAPTNPSPAPAHKTSFGRSQTFHFAERIFREELQRSAAMRMKMRNVEPKRLKSKPPPSMSLPSMSPPPISLLHSQSSPLLMTQGIELRETILSDSQYLVPRP